MRALLAAIQCEKGDTDGNLAAHLAILGQAATARCDLAVFPEMSLTGSVDPVARPERLIAADHQAAVRAAQGRGVLAGGVRLVAAVRPGRRQQARAP